MWMEEKISSVKGKSQSGLYDSKMYWQHKMAKEERKSARDFRNLHILPEISGEGLGSRKECC